MSALDSAILALMHRASEQAIMPRYRALSADQVEHKAADDVVTVADREAEAILAEGLSSIDSSLAIVGEEAAHDDPAVLDALKGDCWIIDPIDGTKNYASGAGPFGILLARAEGGVAVSGWIYDCQSGRFCAAHANEGAFVDGERYTARSTDQERPVAAISLIFVDEALRAPVREALAPHCTLVDTPRCAAEQYPRLGMGMNDVSYFDRTLAWDHAAGVLWLSEAGGKVARFDGTQYRVDEWDRRGLIGAASPQLWDTLAERLAPVLGQS